MSEEEKILVSDAIKSLIDCISPKMHQAKPLTVEEIKKISCQMLKGIEKSLTLLDQIVPIESLKLKNDCNI